MSAHGSNAYKISKSSRYYMAPDSEQNHGPCITKKAADPEKLKALQETKKKHSVIDHKRVFNPPTVMRKFSEEELANMKGFLEI